MDDGKSALALDSSPTLFEVLGALPDPRSRHGQIHPLSAVLGMVVLGVLLGRTSLAAIARLGRQYGVPLAHALGFNRGKTPAVSTLSRTLRRFDPQQLEAILAEWISRRIDPEAYEQISIDGKTLRGSRAGEVPGQHLLAAYAHQQQAVLAQMQVDASTNEHKAALELLGVLPLKGKVVVADAIFCQRDLAAKVIAAEGDYVLTAKDNQPGLQINVRAGFGFDHAARSIEAATSPWRSAAAASRPHGDDRGKRPRPN